MRNRWLVLFGIAALSLVTACDDDGDNTPSDTGVDVGVDAADASDGGADATVDADVGDDTPDTTDADDTTPEVSVDVDAGDTTAPEVSVNVAANPTNTLSAYVDVSIDEPAQVTVTVSETGGEWTWTDTTDGVVTGDDLITFFVMGMHADTDYTVDVSATDEADNEGVGTASHTSGSLPDDFPPLDVTVSQPDLMSGEYTLFSVFRWSPGVDSNWGYIIVLDAAGLPVWYWDTQGGGGDTRLNAAGNIIINLEDERIVEVSWTGEILSTITAEELGVDSIHHEWFTLPDGNIAFLGSELRNIDGYDDGEGGTVAYDVIADTIHVYDPIAGALVDDETLSMFDVLDPLNVRPGFDGPFWNQHYADVAPDGVKDWTHGNALVYDEDDDAWIVSIRHQDMVIKVDRATGDLIWATGPDGNLDLAAGDWVYHPHAPELQADGSVLVYDNGNLRESLADGEPQFSRVTVFEVDESDADPANWTYTETWEYTGDAPYFAPFVGDADMLEGTVLICDGGIVSDESIGFGLPENQKSARIREVTFEETPTVVFEVNISDESEVDPSGYTVYRAARLDALGVPAQ